MIRIHHHIWPFHHGEEIAGKQKKRLYEKIKDEFSYIPNIVEYKENENHTLQKLISVIENYDDNDNVLYLHTKGATQNHLVHKQWREYMERELIDDYKTHIKILDKNFDTSGVLMGIPNWSDHIYGGNFWWAKASFLKKIPKNLHEHLDFSVRHHAEFKFLSLVPNWFPYSKPFYNFETVNEFSLFIVKNMLETIVNKSIFK